MRALASKNKLVAPVLKWVGGKRQILPSLLPLLPDNISVYCEPFVGGGAMLFQLQPNEIYINDINSELMRVYSVIMNEVEALIQALIGFENNAETYYSVRDWDRNKEKYAELPEVKKAARILYLNKTCFNGLFRVNRAGEFNSPFGYYKNPNIVNAPILRAVSKYLNRATTHLSSIDYAKVLAGLPQGAFVYLDPPYDPVSETSNFTGYSKGGFTREDQLRLRKSCDNLSKRNIKFMLSNSATTFIKELYSAYDVKVVLARRAVNANGSKRGEIDEVVVRNYE